jgi:hypothetical protein
MIMKITPFLAMHGHVGGGGDGLLLLLFIFLAGLLLISCWPDNSQTK